MTRQGLLVALPPVDVPAVPLGGGEPAHVQALQDPPHPRRTDHDVVVALQVHGALVGAEVAALAEVDDLVDHLRPGGIGGSRGVGVSGPAAPPGPAPRTGGATCSRPAA